MTDKKKKEFLVKPNDELYVSVRCRVVDFGKDKSGLDVVKIAMDELLINGIVKEELFFWAPLMLIKQKVEDNQENIAHVSKVSGMNAMEIPKDFDMLREYDKKENSSAYRKK